MLTVYSRSTEPWLLVPGCLLPTEAAVRLYGPLAYVGSFPVQRLPVHELAMVQSEFDEASFARIPAKTALRLLALGIRARVGRALGFRVRSWDGSRVS